MPDTVIAGTSGVPVVGDTAGFDLQPYVGGAFTLTVNIEGPKGREFTKTVTATADFLHWTFTTIASDFPYPGMYYVELEIANGTNVLFVSGQDSVECLPRV